jgi:hypothetical protein
MASKPLSPADSRALVPEAQRRIGGRPDYNSRVIPLQREIDTTDGMRIAKLQRVQYVPADDVCGVALWF